MSVETDLRLHEIRAERDDAEFNRKLAIFRQAPYDCCEWVIERMSKTDLLDLALAYVLDHFDTEAAANHRPSQCAIKDVLAGIEDAVWEIET